jgi:two-component system cell cycle sensor histidine kinase/response regulator CckA
MSTIATACHVELPCPRPEGRATVLVVEDEQAVRRLNVCVLRAAGYEVLEAGSGPEALRVADGFAGPIDAVVTDLVLPGLSGEKLAARLAATRPGVKVLFTSGCAEGRLRGLESHEASGTFLQKPYSLAALTRAVQALLEGGR